MGEFIDKVKGATNEAVGQVKQAIGKNNNDPDLAADGAAQETKGNAQQVKGSVKGALGDTI
ncbi:CsbD family protein [Sphingomonas sp. ID0503]|uniref:CsbD family protein n=1 Tax=Sphingomonas sp. ID0503 TaxID=3399691 RepID=UPI003AFADFD6